MLRLRPTFCLLLPLTLGLSACAKKPTEEQCREFATHFVELLAESEAGRATADRVAKQRETQLIETCAYQGTAKEVECVLASKTLEEVQANCK